jgi:hypothetical protein
MLAALEQAIVDFAREQWPEHGGAGQVTEFDIGNDFDDIIGTPAMAVATEAIALKRNADGSINFKPTVSVYLAYKNVGKPDQRRKGISPILTGAIAILSNRTFDIDIEPLLPLSCSEVLHANLKSKGLIGYRLQFSTDFDADAIDIDDAQRLIEIGIDYYDTNDTPALRAADEIEYEE